MLVKEFIPYLTLSDYDTIYVNHTPTELVDLFRCDKQLISTKLATHYKSLDPDDINVEIEYTDAYYDTYNFTDLIDKIHKTIPQNSIVVGIDLYLIVKE